MEHSHFMQIALQEAEAALETGEFPVGCVLVHDRQLLAAGRRSGTAEKGINEIDHAEMAALRRLTELRPPEDLTGLAAYSTLEPCLMCLGALILNRVDTIVFAYEDAMGGATGCDFNKLGPLYRQAGIVIVPHILREQSLRHFQTYFRRPENSYWKDSLLARYTLEQD